MALVQITPFCMDSSSLGSPETAKPATQITEVNFERKYGGLDWWPHKETEQRL